MYNNTNINIQRVQIGKVPLRNWGINIRKFHLPDEKSVCASFKRNTLEVACRWYLTIITWKDYMESRRRIYLPNHKNRDELRREFIRARRIVPYCIMVSWSHVKATWNISWSKTVFGISYLKSWSTIAHVTTSRKRTVFSVLMSRFQLAQIVLRSSD